MAVDTREWDQLIFQGQQHAVGTSVRGLTAELYEVLKEFFTDSNSWREDILFDAEADVKSYAITPFEGGKIIRLMGVWGDNNSPWAAFMNDFGTVVLLNAPSQTPSAPWMARVVKTIGVPVDKEGKPDAPEWVLSVYSTHILDGLLGRLMAMPGKAWTNPTQSVYHLKRFRAGIQLARTNASRANLVGAQEWAYPRNATGGTQRSGTSGNWPIM
jgi:hypothetical protein